MTKPTKSPDQKPQGQKFTDLARELECDEDEAAFKAKLRHVARAPALQRPVKDKKT